MATRILVKYDAETFGLTFAYRDLAELASRLNRSSAAHFFSRFAFLATKGVGGPAGRQLQKLVLERLISPAISQPAIANRKLDRDGVYLTKQNALYVMSLICLYGQPDEGGLNPLTESGAQWILGELLLKASSVIHYVTDDRKELSSDMLADINPFRVPTQALHQIFRSRLAEYCADDYLAYVKANMFWFKLLPSIAARHGSVMDPFILKFTEDTAANPEDVILLGFAIILMQTNYSTDSIFEPAGINRDQFFSNFTWDKERVDRTLSYLSLQANESEKFILNESCPDFHSFVFESRPMVSSGSQYSLVNSQAMLDILSLGLLLRMADGLDPKNRSLLRCWIGEAFEEYCYWFMQNAHAEGAHKSTGVRRGQKQGELDIIVDDGLVEILIECKLETIDKSVIFGGGPQLYANSFFFSKSYTTAVKQLATWAEKLIDAPHPPKRIIPVIVVSDEVLGQFCAQLELNTHFQEEFGKIVNTRIDREVPFMCQRVILLTLSDFEQVCLRVAHGQKLKDILDGICADDKLGVKLASMSLANRPINLNRRLKFLDSEVREMSGRFTPILVQRGS